MSRGDHRLEAYEAINAALEEWRQGDCVLGEEWFLVRGNPAGDSPVPDEGEVLEASVAGLVVVTQTCDIVRDCEERPYVEVSPLVLSEDFEGVRAGRRPSYGYVPGLADQKLVADLDRTMTVTKNVLAGWIRVAGVRTDDEARQFARALERKRGRFAFPDDFNSLCSDLKRRLTEKHDKQTLEGAALRRLREVRVEASPSWNSDAVSLTFWFIRHGADSGEDWAQQLQAWLTLFRPAGRYVDVQGTVSTLEGMKASDYLHSDRLDLDHISRKA